MRQTFFLLLLTLVSSFYQQILAQHYATETKQENRLIVLKNGTVFNGKQSDTPSVRDIYICNDTIAAVTSAPEEAPAGFEQAEVYDLGGKFVIPGLIDAHVHLITKTDNMLEDVQEDLTNLLKKQLMAGITTVRDMGGDGLLLGTFARSANAGRIASPDIFYSSFLAGRAYYNSFALRPQDSDEYIPDENLPWKQTIDDDSDAETIMTRVKACGATGIKLYNDISPETLKKLCTEAKRQGLRVWAHATIIPSLPSDAVEAGVEVLSHAYLMLYEQMKGKNKKFDFDHETACSLEHDFEGLDTLFSAMKKNNIILDATIFLNSLGGKESPDWINAAFVVKQAHKHGVKICIGTDWMYNEEKDMANAIEEISLFVEECGFTPADAIVAATQISAEAIGLNDRGILAIGKRADILVLNKNPFDNIRNINSVNKVIKKGVVY